MATAIPFHRAVARAPAFASDPYSVHTCGIETEFVHRIKPFTTLADPEPEEEPGRESVVVEVGGRPLEISLPSSPGMVPARTCLAAGATPRRRAAKKPGPVASGDTLASPCRAPSSRSPSRRPRRGLSAESEPPSPPARPSVKSRTDFRSRTLHSWTHPHSHL